MCFVLLVKPLYKQIWFLGVWYWPPFIVAMLVLYFPSFKLSEFLCWYMFTGRKADRGSAALVARGKRPQNVRQEEGGARQ